jgi:hypothetical protein
MGEFQMRFLGKALTATSVAGVAAACLVGGSGLAAADTQASLHLNPTTATQGELIKIFATCGADEGLNYVGSEAFQPTGGQGPYAPGGGGIAKITKRHNGRYYGYVFVRNDIAPGTYHVGERCGGGNAGGVDLTVVNAG